MTDPILSGLRKVTRGVLYPSESDFPLVPFDWPAGKNTAATVRRNGGAEGAVRRMGLDDLLGDLGAADPQFRRLKDWLEANLTGVHVYWFGAVRRAVYVVGTATDGRLVGFHTVAIET